MKESSIKLKNMILESIKVETGHLTSRDKRVIQIMIDSGTFEGSVGKTDYYISDMGDGRYEVIQKVIDKGLIPVAGSKSRLSTYKSIIHIK
jgi:hypothetical protein